jgi:hypothetical protein
MERLRDELLENRKGWGTRNSTAKPEPLMSLAFEPIGLIHVGWEARKAPVDAVVLSLDFHFCRT